MSNSKRAATFHPNDGPDAHAANRAELDDLDTQDGDEETQDDEAERYETTPAEPSTSGARIFPPYPRSIP